jgi:hypothetical protein
MFSTGLMLMAMVPTVRAGKSGIFTIGFKLGCSIMNSALVRDLRPRKGGDQHSYPMKSEGVLIALALYDTALPGLDHVGNHTRRGDLRPASREGLSLLVETGTGSADRLHTFASIASPKLLTLLAADPVNWSYCSGKMGLLK